MTPDCKQTIDEAIKIVESGQVYNLSDPNITFPQYLASLTKQMDGEPIQSLKDYLSDPDWFEEEFEYFSDPRREVKWDTEDLELEETFPTFAEALAFAEKKAKEEGVIFVAVCDRDGCAMDDYTWDNGEKI